MEHRRYKRGLEERYTEYFAAQPELRGIHKRKARDLPAALPAGFEGLERWLPESVRHLHYLSGGSSQVVALALLGAACRGGPSLRWYGELLDLPLLARGGSPKVQFEFAPDSLVLGERKDFPTTVDVLVSDDALFACGEAKYWEAGLGRCTSCAKNAPDSEDGGRKADPAETSGCSSEVRGRARYWVTAREVLGLPERVDGQACPIASAYQGARNAAPPWLWHRVGGPRSFCSTTSATRTLCRQVHGLGGLRISRRSLMPAIEPSSSGVAHGNAFWAPARCPTQLPSGRVRSTVSNPRRPSGPRSLHSRGVPTVIGAQSAIAE
jgi:hypothetical protein